VWPEGSCGQTAKRRGSGGAALCTCLRHHANVMVRTTQNEQREGATVANRWQTGGRLSGAGSQARRCRTRPRSASSPPGRGSRGEESRREAAASKEEQQRAPRGDKGQVCFPSTHSDPHSRSFTRPPRDARARLQIDMQMRGKRGFRMGKQ
jgi:hypothetical protein